MTKEKRLLELYEKCRGCNGCPLHKTRTNCVFGKGNPEAKVMFIGEAPGETEDQRGLPFVGKAGMLLDKFFLAADIGMDEIYVANILKCRPPNNRVPEEAEAAACRLHLRNQFALVRPQVIVLLGSTAAKNVLGPEIRITRDRGRWFERKGVWFMPTYHPSALLRDPAKKREAWEDMQSLRDRLMELGLYQDIYGNA